MKSKWKREREYDKNTKHNKQYTVELQWLEQLWNHENMFEIGEVRANEC